MTLREFWQGWIESPWYAKGMCWLAFTAVLFGIVNEIVRAS